MNRPTKADNLRVIARRTAEQRASAKNPHTYGAGTRLSSAYTAGRDGLPLPGYCAVRGSAAAKAWRIGRNERRKGVRS